MGVEGTAVDVVIISPDYFEKIVAVLGLAGTLAEVEEEFELGGGEGEWFFVEIEGEVVFIETEGAEGEDDGAGSGAISFDDGLDAEEEFFGAEGFCEVVIGTEFETPDPVVDLALGGEHEDGDGVGAAVALHFLKDLVAVHDGEHEVEDDKGGLVAEDEFKSFASITGDGDLVAGAFEIKGDEVGDIDFVLDDENVFHF